MDQRQSFLTGAGIMVGVLLTFLVPYIAGYFLLGSVGTGGMTRFRVYKYEWQEIIYRPATAAESLFTGRAVMAAHRPPE